MNEPFNVRLKELGKNINNGTDSNQAGNNK